MDTAEREQSIFERYEVARARWHQACIDFSKADAEKASARVEWESAASAVGQKLEEDSQNPAEPQQPLGETRKAGIAATPPPQIHHRY